MKRPLSLTLIVGWTGTCALWLIYGMFQQFLMLIDWGDGGPAGYLLNRTSALTLCAIPVQLQLMTSIALMSEGSMGITVELLIACSLLLISVGLWGLNQAARRFAIGFIALEFVLLAIDIFYIEPSIDAASNDFIFLMRAGLVFLVLHGLSVAYLAQPSVGRLFRRVGKP